MTAGGGNPEAASALASFALEGEGPTLAGVLAERLNRDPRVAFAAYTVPHPSEKRVIVQVRRPSPPPPPPPPPPFRPPDAAPLSAGGFLARAC